MKTSLRSKRPALAQPATPEELRKRAQAERLAGEEEARRVIESSVDEAERLEREADELELADRVQARREELTREAASLARSGLDARDAAEHATVEADDLAGQVAGLAAELERQEGLRRDRLRAIEEATAAGDLERANQLEDLLASIAVDSVRSELAEARACEAAARDRAAQALADAERFASEAADHRRALEFVESNLRPEYERRREDREKARAAHLTAFDSRLGNAVIVAGAISAALAAQPDERGVDSSSVVLKGITLVKDADGRLTDIALPI